MSSLAQEERRSISENVTWGQRKRFADVKVSFAYSRFLGLDKDKETGKIVINPEQAETAKVSMAVKRAALYIRVSTEEQARHGYSLGEQRMDLETYAKNKNYAVVDVYADEGVSARKTMSRRKELQRLLRDVENGLIDVIIIKCLDRWFRNIADFYKVKEFLDEHHVEWECTQEEYNTTTTNGRLLLNLKLSIAQNESDQTSDRIRYVNEGKRRRKEVVGGSIPLGYSVDANRHLVPNDDAPIVQEIFRHIANGNSYRSSVPLIQDKFGFQIAGSRVFHIVRNRTYIGEYHDIANFCEPIISLELFNKVQEILSRHFRTSKQNRIYLFRGLIRCPKCKKPLRGHATPSGIYQYRCYSLEEYKKCDFHGIINESKLENWLIENIQTLLQAEIYEVETKYRKNSVNFHGKLTAVKAKLGRLKDLYLDGLIDKETYEKDYATLTEQEREYTSMIARNNRVVSPALRRILNWEDLNKMYGKLDNNSKQELWQSVIREITFDLERVPGHQYKKTFHIKFLT
ncbi:MAG: recombinase family protein [Selenomonadaceae bacterium]|nr:recombinase family protein [Selenomonadaceae bacterium]